MSKVHCLVFLVIGVLLMLLLVVDAQPTVDDGESCEFDETARDVKLIRKDLTEVKNMKEDLAELKNICARSAVDSTSLCEYKTCSRLSSRVV